MFTIADFLLALFAKISNILNHRELSIPYKLIPRASFSRNCLFECINSPQFSDRNYLSLKGLEPATSCVRDQDATTVPARHM